MKNVFLRLCGGFSVMIRPDSDLGLDLSKVDVPDVIKRGNSMMKFMWEGVEVTLHANGGLIFYHLEDQELAGRYALDIYRAIGVSVRTVPL